MCLYVSIIPYRIEQNKLMGLKSKFRSPLTSLNCWVRLVLSFVFKTHYALKTAQFLSNSLKTIVSFFVWSPYFDMLLISISERRILLIGWHLFFLRFNQLNDHTYIDCSCCVVLDCVGKIWVRNTVKSAFRRRNTSRKSKTHNQTENEHWKMRAKGRILFIPIDNHQHTNKKLRRELGLVENLYKGIFIWAGWR